MCTSRPLISSPRVEFYLYDRRAGRVLGHSPRQHASQRLTCATRKSLLLGTALASTLLIGILVAPTPAAAVVVTCVGDVGTGPAPILHSGAGPGFLGEVDSIRCMNTEARNAAGALDQYAAIELSTTGADHFITLDNSGDLVAGPVAGVEVYGIFARTFVSGPIDIKNSGEVTVTSQNRKAWGIFSRTRDDDSTIGIVNTGDITVTSVTTHAYGIYAHTDLAAASNNAITIQNSGTLMVTGGEKAFGIWAQPLSADGPITIVNSGTITATATAEEAYGIYAHASDNSKITVINSGDVTATSTGGNAFSIYAYTSGDYSPIDIQNSGDVTATATGGDAYGIFAKTRGANGRITIVNNGSIQSSGPGIRVYSAGGGSPIDIANYAAITSMGDGIFARAMGIGSSVSIFNSGDINAHAGATTTGDAIYAHTVLANSSIAVVNQGTLMGESDGIDARAFGAGSPVTITNSGMVEGKSTGVYSYSNTSTTIVNSGSISAASLLAIKVAGKGDATIFNAGTITGFVVLDADDSFTNQAGGVFEAREISDFGDGNGAGDNDLFRNQAGALVHTANNANAAETTVFVNLERFDNQGTISTVDGGTGDLFVISNTGGTDLNFVGSGNSTLAVDAFLGGPGNSSSDVFRVEGKVSGSTTVAINNTNTGPGVFNPSGIKVVTVTGATPTGNEFSLANPIDTGFFDYDLFFTPTGSGFWDLKSYPGGGAFLLPQLVTAAQDIWHQGSSTWFDRTADLRVLLAGGAAPASAPGAYGNGAPQGDGLTPAVWVRGSGGWLDRDDTETTTAYGRTYTFDLDRELQTMDFQMGIDLGKRDLLSQGDILVFGMLGGFVHADLDYDAINRAFDFSGGQVGAYATYLKGGLFVDTLLNVHLYELDTATLGFPRSLDANTVGLRTDTGYRFGSFSGGAFLEPLATMEFTWADIDGFSLGGNTVSFDDDANVRGRLGLRAGTTMQAWKGTMMEPFVIGSLWGNFTDDNQATLVSTGTTFRFQDDLDDLWGEVSAGVNFFNPSATTAVFAKLDVTFGDDVTGLGGKAGMRVSW